MTELLEIARRVAVEAGDQARRRREEGVTVAATKSSQEDIVTLADRESEETIRGRLADARPGDGFLGEEGGSAESTSGLTWVVDPIDGTVNYFYGIPNWCVSVAVMEGTGRPSPANTLAGVVYNPVSGEVFAASRGGGAFLGERPLTVNAEVEPGIALVGTGFAYDPAVRVEQAGVVQGIIGRVRDVRRFGAAALDISSVAAGRLDAYYERELNPWDHAAGGLIAAEAGASVRHVDGRDPFMVVAPPRLAGWLETTLLELGH